MANLFWKTPTKTTRLLDTPFKAEEEFERLVFATPELLEDIFLLKRQIRGGGKQGIPDIVGVDNDGNICIIEMKNVTVDAAIIPRSCSMPSGPRQILIPSSRCGSKLKASRRMCRSIGMISKSGSL